MSEFTSLVAVPVHTRDGVRHVTGQVIDVDGLLAVHPELSADAGFTGRWQITNVLTGQPITLADSTWTQLVDCRELAPGGET